MKEESEEKIADEEPNEQMDGEVNRLLVYGLIVAVIILVPAAVVMWVAM